MVIKQNEADAFEAIADLYQHADTGQLISFSVRNCFEVKWTHIWHAISHGWSGWEACHPLDEGCLRRQPDCGSEGFLHQHAVIVEGLIIKFLVDTKRRNPHTWQHLPISICANEFKCWAVGGGDEVGVVALKTMQQPTEDNRNTIRERLMICERCWRSTASIERIADFQSFVKLMKGIQVTLKQALDQWDCFEAQQDVRIRIEALRKNMRTILREGLSYCYYVLSDSELHRRFEPAVYNACFHEETVHVQNTLRGRLMRELLLDPAVQSCLNDCAIQNYMGCPLFPRLDAGLHELEDRFNKGSLTPEVFQDDDSGIVAPGACGMDDETWNGAWRRFLGMHTALAVVAIIHGIFRYMEELSKVGGELLRSASTPKQFIQLALRLSRIALEAIVGEDGYAAGIESSISKALGKLSAEAHCMEDVPWSRNREKAAEYLARLRAVRAECSQGLEELQQRIDSLTVEELNRKETQGTMALRKLLEDSASRFEGWNDFHLADADRKVLPDVGRSPRSRLAPSREHPQHERGAEEEHIIARKFKNSPLLRNQDDLRPSFDGALRVFLMGRVNSGKTSLLNQILMAGIERQKKMFWSKSGSHGLDLDERGFVRGVTHQARAIGVHVGWRLVLINEQPFEHGLFEDALLEGVVSLTFELGVLPQQVAFLPEDNVSNTRVLWHLRQVPPSNDDGRVKVFSIFMNEAAVEEVYEEVALTNMNDLAEYTLRLSKNLRIRGHPITSRPGELGHIEVHLPRQSVLRIQGKAFDWIRPTILDHVILIDSPGLGEKLEPTGQSTEDIVKNFAHKQACVFVWCIGYDQGAAVTKDCELAVRMSEQVPQAMLVVITKVNKAFDDLQRCGQRGRALQDKRKVVEDKYDEKNKLEEKIAELSETVDMELPFKVSQKEELHAALAKMDRVIKNLEIAINTHQIHENLRTLSERLEQLIRGARPVAFVGNAFCGVDAELGLDRTLMWALLKTLERRFVQEAQRSSRCALSELTRLRLNASNFLTEVLNLSSKQEVRFSPGESGLAVNAACLVSRVGGQSLQLGVKTGWKALHVNGVGYCSALLQEAESSGAPYCVSFQEINSHETPKLLFMRRPDFVEESQNIVLSTYNQKVCVELSHEVEHNLQAILVEAHERLVAERGAWRWFDPAGAYVHRLMSAMQVELQRLLAKETEWRTAAIREAALRTYRWLCDEVPGSHQPGMGQIRQLRVRSDQDFQRVMKCLDEHCAVQSTLELDDPAQVIPTNSILVTCSSNGITERVRTKAALQCHRPPAVLRFDTFLDEFPVVSVHACSVGPSTFCHGGLGSTFLAGVGVAACGFGARYLADVCGVLFAEIFGGPWVWLISGISFAAAIANHTSYSYENKRKIVEEHFNDYVIPRFRQSVEDQKQHLQMEVEEVITNVVARFLSMKSNAEVAAVTNHSSYINTLLQAESYLADIRDELEREKASFNQKQKLFRERYNSFLEYEENTQMSQAQDQLYTLTFQPGPVGLTIQGETPVLTAVDKGGQAERLGVKVHWLMTKINGQDYKESLLNKAIAGDEPYTVVFTENKLSRKKDVPCDIHDIILNNICAKSASNVITDEIATRPLRIVSPDGCSLLVNDASSKSKSTLTCNTQCQQLDPVVFTPCICDITNFLLEEFIWDFHEKHELSSTQLRKVSA